MRVPEEQAHAAAFVAAETKYRRPIHRNTTHAVNLAERAFAETLTRRTLINRMNVVVFAAIHSADGEHIVDGLRGIPLSLAQHRPQHRIAVALVDLLVNPLRQLHDQERQAFAPQRTPFTNHHAQQLTVGSAIWLVFLALIPQESSQGIGHNTLQHGMERASRTPLRSRRHRRRPRAFAILLGQRIPRHIRIGFTSCSNRRIPRIRTRLPFAILQIELFLRFTGDRLLVASKIIAPGFTGIQCVLAHPTANRRTPDITVDNADWKVGIKFITQFSREIVRYGTHHATIFGR